MPHTAAPRTRPCRSAGVDDAASLGFGELGFKELGFKELGVGESVAMRVAELIRA